MPNPKTLYQRGHKAASLPSKKGAEYVHTEACILDHADNHNDRVGPISNLNVRPELTETNYAWKDHSTPDLKELDIKIREDYYSVERVDKSGRNYHRHLPSKGNTASAPIKESILLLPSNGKETEQMVDDFVRMVEEYMGWRRVRVYIHRDEVFEDPITKTESINNHAHIVWDTYDWNQHLCKRVNNANLRKFQDFAAKATGMPRGNDARMTKASHKSVHVYKAEQEMVKLNELSRQVEDRQSQVRTLDSEIEVLLGKKEELSKELQVHENDFRKLIGKEHLILSELGRGLAKQYDGLTKLVESSNEDNRLRELLEEELRVKLESNRLESWIAHINRLHAILTQVMEVIRRLSEKVIIAAKEAKMSLNLIRKRSKILKAFIPEEEVKELKTVETLQSELERMKWRLEASEKRRETVFERAERVGIEFNEEKVQSIIRKELERIFDKQTLPLNCVKDLLAGEYVIFQDARIGSRYLVRYNYRLQKIEMRVNDALANGQNMWALSSKEADEKWDNRQAEMLKILSSTKEDSRGLEEQTEISL